MATIDPKTDHTTTPTIPPPAPSAPQSAEVVVPSDGARRPIGVSNRPDDTGANPSLSPGMGKPYSPAIDAVRVAGDRAIYLVAVLVVGYLQIHGKLDIQSASLLCLIAGIRPHNIADALSRPGGGSQGGAAGAFVAFQGAHKWDVIRSFFGT